MYLDFDSLYYIFDKLNTFDELFNIIILNKDFFLVFIKKFNNDLSLCKKSNIDRFPIFIQNLFNNQVLMRDLNELDFKETFLDELGWMRNINIEEMMDNIMYGYDQRGNCYLVLKLNMNINNARSLVTPLIITQKPSAYYRWCITSNEPYYGIIFNNIINHNDILIIKDLLRGETLNYYNCKIWI